MSLVTLFVTTVKGQVAIIFGHWILDLCFDLVSGACAMLRDGECMRLLLPGLAALLPPPLVLLLLLVLVLDQHEGDVLSLQRHRLQCNGRFRTRNGNTSD